MTTYEPGETGHSPVPTADREKLREKAEEFLAALVGSPDARLRDDQWVAIEALVADRRRALVVQRTGWGKSAVYFVATALLRDAGAGPTVIVSPLLALMRNQIAAAARAGIRAVTINSTNADDWSQTYAAINAGEVDVLLVSPERLNNPGFRDEVLPRLAATTGLLVIDEAHCISDWGHDFRPDYRRIRTLLRELPDGIPVLATTATANARVTADVAEQLGARVLKAASEPGVSVGAGPEFAGSEVLVQRGPLDRESLHLTVVNLPDAADRLGWLGQHLDSFTGSGIIYCLTVAQTVEVADHLTARGYEIAAYSGQTEQTERERLEDALLTNQVKALVATSALGMGFDKPDLGFVIHLGAPDSPIAYYQQVGRAGRGLAHATAVLLPAAEDRAIWAYFGSLAFPPEQDVRTSLAALAEQDRPLSTAALETFVPLKRGRLEAMLKVLDVDGAVRRVKGGWVSTGGEWAYDTERYQRVADHRTAEQQSMLDYQATSECRMAFLRTVLDDRDNHTEGGIAPCGRCDNCGGTVVASTVDSSARSAATAHLDRPGVPVQTRRAWPTGLANLGINLKGKVAADELAETGRAVARLDGLGWSGALRELFAAGSGDQETPVPLRHAIVKVLGSWEFEQKPDGIVYVASAARPTLVSHLATGLARYTGWPLLGFFEPRLDVDEPAISTNSAQRLRVVLSRLDGGWRPNADAGAIEGRTVLLVDDYTDSGWTLTVAARALRQAGAATVHPLTLAVR